MPLYRLNQLELLHTHAQRQSSDTNHQDAVTVPIRGRITLKESNFRFSLVDWKLIGHFNRLNGV